MKKSVQEIENDIREAKKSFRSYRLDMSFGELMNLYEENQLIISPSYQRLFRWDIHQRTRFIESLLIGIPIPTIFVSENKEGKWEVVDGLQRLSTFFSFFGKLNVEDKDNWKMSKPELIKSLKGFTWKDLPMQSQLKLKRSTCSVEIIEYGSDDYTIKYELFNRLNTGGTKLSEQEIRNVIYRDISEDFNKFLEEYQKNPRFIKLIPITENKRNALYLEELVLRFCSLYNNLDDIKGNLTQYMNNFMLKTVEDIKNDPNNTIIEDYKNILNRTINLLEPLGPTIFYSKKEKGKKFSTSFYDGIMVGVSKNIDFYEKNPKKIKGKINELKNSEEFEKYTGSVAHNKKNVVGRLKTAEKIFKND